MGIIQRTMISGVKISDVTTFFRDRYLHLWGVSKGYFCLIRIPSQNVVKDWSRMLLISSPDILESFPRHRLQYKIMIVPITLIFRKS